MTDPDKELTPALVRDAITEWAVTPAVAKAEARKISLRWHLITTVVCAVVAALLSLAMAWTVVATWSPTFEIAHPSGQVETCQRVPAGPANVRRYHCRVTG